MRVVSSSLRAHPALAVATYRSPRFQSETLSPCSLSISSFLLATHNSGQVPHTAEFGLWYMETAIALHDKDKAFAYGLYLKSSAGRAYAAEHF